ncbi:RluA family pseudouridine synthase [Cellvibrio sp. QJXJ]|uniref:RluA family pseudouridine synthase n=1 Tax=Cellvibrio sp. QJXJ TaxID=2964606 RepID=UPI0021C33BB4|nr:RluA family pseudouridine synthase [Cellvibrio sp. QJXJ]UUA73051.1 RluA family pseudouridine synthase [Cellvibrio sp. QJXJ]
MSDTSFEIPQKFEFTVTQTEQTALDLLAEGTGLSKQRIKDAMNKGAVWWTLKGKTLRLRRATKVLYKGSRIQFFYDEQVLARKPETATLIYDAGNYSIWFKPPGMLSQGSQWGDHCSILRWVEVNGQFTQGREKRECFLVHRLDGDASGLIILAHDSQAAAKLSTLFQARDMHKFYQAWVVDDCEVPTSGLTLSYELDGKSAITHIKKIRAENNKTLLDVTIETGRKHQIRRHLANIGHPIVGDRVYGKKASVGLQLLAYRLEFICPFSQQRVVAELPKEVQFN